MRQRHGGPAPRRRKGRRPRAADRRPHCHGRHDDGGPQAAGETGRDGDRGRRHRGPARAGRLQTAARIRPAAVHAGGLRGPLITAAQSPTSCGPQGQFSSPYWVLLRSGAGPSDPGISVSSNPVGCEGGSKGPERTGTPGLAAASGTAAVVPAAEARARLNAATSSASMGSYRGAGRGAAAGAVGAAAGATAGAARGGRSGAGGGGAGGGPGAPGRGGGGGGGGGGAVAAAVGTGATGRAGVATTGAGAVATGTGRRASGGAACREAPWGATPFWGIPTATWSLMRQYTAVTRMS